MQVAGPGVDTPALALVSQGWEQGDQVVTTQYGTGARGQGDPGHSIHRAGPEPPPAAAHSSGATTVGDTCTVVGTVTHCTERVVKPVVAAPQGALHADQLELMTHVKATPRPSDCDGVGVALAVPVVVEVVAV